MKVNPNEKKPIFTIPFTRRGVKRRAVILDHPIGNLERCRECGADCCRSFPAVNITWSEYNTLLALGAKRLHFSLSGRCKLILEDGCEFLVANRCSVYHQRPEGCRRFVCADVAEQVPGRRFWWGRVPPAPLSDAPETL